jgi:hypothetical protein
VLPEASKYLLLLGFQNVVNFKIAVRKQTYHCAAQSSSGAFTPTRDFFVKSYAIKHLTRAARVRYSAAEGKRFYQIHFIIEFISTEDFKRSDFERRRAVMLIALTR